MRPGDGLATRTANIRPVDLVWLCGISLAILLSLVPFSSYVALLPSIRAEWGLSNSEAGIVFSSNLIGFAVGSLVLVPLTDRFGARSVFLFGVAVALAAELLFSSLASGFGSAVALRLVAGVGHVAVYVPGIQMVSARFAGPRRGSAVAAFVSAGYAGTTLSYVVTGAFAPIASTWQEAYLWTALVAVGAFPLAILVALRTVPLRTSRLAGAARGATDQPSVTGRHAPGQPSREAGPTVQAPGHTGARRDPAPGEPGVPATRASGTLDLGILRYRPAMLTIAAYALHSAELYLARLWLPLLLGAALIHAGRAPETSAALAATLSGFMFSLGIAGAFLGGPLSDRVGRTKGAILIFATSGALSFTVGWLVNTPLAFLVAAGFVYGFATAADSAIYFTAVTELVPAGRIGSAQAIQTFAGFAIGAIAPVIAGSFLDLAPASIEWGVAFSFNGLLAVAGVLILLRLRRIPEAAPLA
ncbi:MAG: MFS transporter [Chloroflexi bacterium]|nr:MFS transporter [Chloroflexota bacterium]